MKRTWVHSFFEALKRAGDPYDAGAGGDPGPHTIEEALRIARARARLMTRKVEFKKYPGSGTLPGDEKAGLGALALSLRAPHLSKKGRRWIQGRD